MGERAFTHEPATAAEAAKMALLVGQAIKAGGLGFSTSRSLNHKGSDGRLTPSWRAAENELSTIARALSACGAGVLQVISDFEDAEAEWPCWSGSAGPEAGRCRYRCSKSTGRRLCGAKFWTG